MSGFETNTGLTSLSKGEWDIVHARVLSPSEVVEHFYKDMPIRRFKDILVSLYDENGLGERLTEGLFQFKSSKALMGLFGANEAFKPPVRDSVRRSVANWLKGNSEPNKRADLIGICFALGLDAQKADMFMRYSSDGAFHLRNPAETALYHCLKSGKSIRESAEFIGGLDLTFGTAKGSAGIVNAGVATSIVAKAYEGVSGDADFVRFLRENRGAFGTMHNTAFEYFKNYIDVLTAPNIMGTKEEKISIENVLKQYLRFNVPLIEKRCGTAADGKSKNTSLKSLDEIQKLIREYWPGETSVKRILERTEEVSRKSLLLLYVVTGGIGQDFYDSSYDERQTDSDIPLALLYGDDMTPEEALENHSIAVNLILQECGFASLDTRNPFDWLILYCLRTDNDEDFMSDRLGCVLKRLFPDDANSF